MDRSIIAKQLAHAHWQIQDDVHLWDISKDSFPWAKHLTFFRAMDRKRRRLLVVVNDASTAFVFDPTRDVHHADVLRDNLAKMNSIFAIESVSLPRSLDLPSAAYALLSAKPGRVASESTWEDAKADLARWEAPEKGALFQRYCQNPNVSVDANGRWQAAFFVLTQSNGFESWALEGNAREIQGARVSIAVPNKTFNLPPRA